MKSQTKIVIGVLVALVAVTAGAVIAAAALLQPTTVTTTDRPPGGEAGDPQPSTTTTTTLIDHPIPDGEWFAWITVQNEKTIWVDRAEILTGQEAHEAAVEAGVITEDEELPNDVFISNPDRQYEPVPFADDATVTVLSGVEPGATLEVATADLLGLYDGTYAGEPVYGIIPGEPIAMTLVLEDGLITSAEAVYLP